MIRSLFFLSGSLSVLDKYKLFELFPIGNNKDLLDFNTSESFFKDDIEKN